MFFLWLFWFNWHQVHVSMFLVSFSAQTVMFIWWALLNTSLFHMLMTPYPHLRHLFPVIPEQCPCVCQRYSTGDMTYELAIHPVECTLRDIYIYMYSYRLAILNTYDNMYNGKNAPKCVCQKPYPRLWWYQVLRLLGNDYIIRTES